MAITVHTTPQSYQPAYNGAFWVASSTNVAQPNFKYYIVVTDLITSATRTYYIEPRPDNKLVFNSSLFAELYVQNYIPKNVYGFQLCSNAVRKIRVNIGERYGTTPADYTGTNQDYIVWNGIVDYLDEPSFNYTSFVYDAPNTNIKYLTHLYDRKTYSGKSLFLYALTSKANDLGKLIIKTYDSSNNLLGTSNIANPYVASTTYTDKYLCIDIGHKGLSNISAGSVSGTYPIITNSVAYYTIEDQTTTGVFPATATTVTSLMRVDIDCEPKYSAYVIHYLAKSGSFETLNCSKVSETSYTKNSTTFKQLPYTLSSNVWSYNTYTSVEKQQTVNTQKNLKLQTEWLTPTEFSYHKEILDSPEIYLDMGTALYSIKLTDNGYLENKKENTKLKNLELNFAFTHTNTRQRSW